MRYKIVRGAEGSPYLGWLEKFADARETSRANPDILSDEQKFDPWNGNYTEQEEANISAYYRVIAGGALQKLTEREREIWKAVFFEKMSLTGAARRLGISVSTVYQSLKRSGKKIKTSILRAQSRLVAKERKYWSLET